jgi:hypothetical protein
VPEQLLPDGMERNEFRRLPAAGDDRACHACHDLIAAGRSATLTFGESARIALPRPTLIAGAFHNIGPVKVLRNHHSYADSSSG